MSDKKKEDPKADEKQLKKLLESYTAVATHKLGRTPSLEELNKMLAEGEAGDLQKGEEESKPNGDQPQAQPAAPASTSTEAQPVAEGDDVPSILKTMVYYGMTEKDGQRQPDPSQVLYYKHPDGRYYDCSSSTWMTQEPPVCAHLPSRSFGQGKVSDNEKDVLSAIVNGVMDDNDYQKLHDVGLITPSAKKVWELSKKAQTLHQDLEKSLELEGEDEEDSELPEVSVDPDLLPTSQEAGENVLQQMLDNAGVSSTEELDDLIEEPGEDIASQIMEAAKVAVGYVMQSDFEERVRSIVREEFQNLINEMNSGAGDPETDDMEGEFEDSDSDDLDNNL
jgi:hypothetical protein